MHKSKIELFSSHSKHFNLHLFFVSILFVVDGITVNIVDIKGNVDGDNIGDVVGFIIEEVIGEGIVDIGKVFSTSENRYSLSGSSEGFSYFVKSIRIEGKLYI